MSLAATSYVLRRTFGNRIRKLLMIVIADFANDAGEAFPSIDTLASRAECSCRSVLEHLAILEKGGELAIALNAGPRGTNLYRILFRKNDADSSTSQGVQELHGGVQMSDAQTTRGGANERRPFAPESSGTVNEPSGRRERASASQLSPPSDSVALPPQTPAERGVMYPTDQITPQLAAVGPPAPRHMTGAEMHNLHGSLRVLDEFTAEDWRRSKRFAGETTVSAVDGLARAVPQYRSSSVKSSSYARAEPVAGEFTSKADATDFSRSLRGKSMPPRNALDRTRLPRFAAASPSPTAAKTAGTSHRPIKRASTCHTANGQMGKWANGQMGKWANGQMGKWKRRLEVFHSSRKLHLPGDIIRDCRISYRSRFAVRPVQAPRCVVDRVVERRLGRPPPSMTRIFTLTITFALGMVPLFGGESISPSPWHSFVDLQGGLYDSNDAYLSTVEGGIGYETGSLVHYLFVGAGQIHRDGERKPDLDEFELGYRAAYRLNEKTSVFAEFGKESLNADTHGTDALGNSVSLSFDSDHCFLGAGFRVDVWKGLDLIFSCRYLPNIENAAFAQAGSDALGNVVTVTEGTPNFLVKLGIGYEF